MRDIYDNIIALASRYINHNMTDNIDARYSEQTAINSWLRVGGDPIAEDG